MQHQIKYKKLPNTMIVVLLCSLFAFQIFNKAVYGHTHIMADGTIVYHAHPYDKQPASAPSKKHHHSKHEYLLLEQLKLEIAVFFVLFHIALSSNNISFSHYLAACYISYYIPHLPGRSPPRI